MEKAENKNPRSLKRSELLWLWNSVSGKRRYVAVLLLIQVSLSVASVARSLMFRELIDYATAKHQQEFLLYLAVLIGLTIFLIAFRALNRWMDERARAEIENTLKHRLFRTLLYKDFASVTAIHSGEWMNRLTSDTVVVANDAAQIIPNFVGMLVKMVGALAAITVLNPGFGILIVILGIALIVITRGFRPALKRLHNRIQESDGMLRILMQERLDNLLIVSTFSQQERSVELVDSQMEQHLKVRMRRNRISNLCSTGFSAAMHGMYLLGAAFCGFGIIQGTVSYGTMTAVLQLITQLQNPIAGFSGYISQWYAMLSSAERLMEAEDFQAAEDESVCSEEECQKLYQDNFEGIRVEDLNFSYSDSGNENPRSVTIRDLNLEIKKGEFIAIVGHSGCGKSTLLKLLMCLYRQDSGRILMTQSAPFSETELCGAYRNLFAYVPQGNQLMSGTIRQILSFYDEQKMKQEDSLWTALKIACADELVSELPQGLDTVLGEHGCGLSEGQIQRLAVARAIFSRRSILLLDEATSSLDESTEARLLENLRTMTDRTVLLVTHRSQACAMCDRVIELDCSELDERVGG